MSMAAHGFGVDAAHHVVSNDVVFLRHGDQDYLARVRQPAVRQSDRRVAVLDVHGGAWCDNDRRFGKRYNEMLAAHGAVVVAIDFRCGATGPHPSASTDVAAAARWVRANAVELGVDPALLVATGSSSGGHLAWLSGLGPTNITPASAGRLSVSDDWMRSDEGDDSFLGVAALWPPVDPLARYRYACGLDTDHGRRLVSNTENYFGTESAMAEASIATVVGGGYATRLPSTLLVVPENDKNVPRHITDAVEAAYRAAGGEIAVQHYPGVGHGFGHAESVDSDRFDADLVSWILSLLD